MAPPLPDVGYQTVIVYSLPPPNGWPSGTDEGRGQEEINDISLGGPWGLG